jgi:hypothetical protein
MNDPSYDFFGSGTTASPATPAAADPMVRPDIRSPRSAEGGPATYDTPTGRVNQFGTPVDVGAVPTGPLAAPGIGAAPTSTPGMVTTWQGPPVQTRAAARLADRDTGVPRNVQAVAVLAIFFGVLAAISAFLGFSQYQQLRSLLDQTATAESSGATTGSVAISGSLADALLTAVLIALVILAVVALVLLVGGGATLANQTWGGWMLVGAGALYVLDEVYAWAHGGYSLFGGIFVAVAVVLLLVLVTGEGGRWLMRR